MPCEVWSLVRKVFVELELELEPELEDLAVLSPNAAARDIEREVSLHDGASSRRSHQAANKRHRTWV